MEKIDKVNDGVAGTAKTIGDVGQIFGNITTEITTWLGKITFTEWILVIVMVAVGVILYYLKEKVRNQTNKTNRYY